MINLASPSAVKMMNKYISSVNDGPQKHAGPQCRTEGLSTDVLEPRTPTGSRIFSSLGRQRTNAKTKAFQLIRVVENALKTITAAFRLPSVAQKRLCLSSLILSKDRPLPNIENNLSLDTSPPGSSLNCPPSG